MVRTKSDKAAQRLWVFDKPLRSDWLYWLAIGLAVVSVALIFPRQDEFESSTTFVLQCLFNAVASVVFVAALLGSIREFSRSRSS